jgi:AraC family transcriptional regulator
MAEAAAVVLDRSAFEGEVAGIGRTVARTRHGLATLTALPASARLPDHAHDTPYLSIYLLGRYRETGDDHDLAIAGPAAVFHPAGSAHADEIGEAGLRTLVVQFDPDWLRSRVAGLPDRSTYWTHGPAAAEATHFARAALRPASAEAVMSRGAALIARWSRMEQRTPPPWLGQLDHWLDEETMQPAPAGLARRLGLSLPWMLRSYRAWRGEGLADTLRRRALERAIGLIGTEPLAEAAVAAGFCDQSHLTRVCRALLGETPGRLRG